MKSALLGAYETSKANDRLAALVSSDYKFLEKCERLDGGISSLTVDFAETSAGQRTKRRHADSFDFIGEEELRAVLEEALESKEADMLEAHNLCRCSPRVFWTLVYYGGRDLESAIKLILKGENMRPQDEKSPLPGEKTNKAEEARLARLEAAERRLNNALSSPENPENTATRKRKDDAVDLALLKCVDGKREAISWLAEVNVSAPRDLAAWRGAAKK